MKKYEHVNSNKYFNQIINNGPVVKNKYYVIHYLHTDKFNYKVGIAVSKKLGKAHYRNYLKRIIRNICDENRFLFKNNTDYIIILTRACVNADYKVLNDELNKALRIIGE